MKVSLLIHNFNRASILERCLSSVAEQTYRPLELVILDAGSTDSSPHIITRAAERMRQTGIEIRNVPVPFTGVATSRNMAAKSATGDLFCFLDNDAAFVSPQSLETLAEIFQTNPRLGVASFRILQGDSNEIDPLTWVFRRSPLEWSDKAFLTFTFTGGGFCIRAEAFHLVGGFWDQLRFSREEEDMAMALVDQGWKIIYSPLVTIRHFADKRGRSSLSQRRYAELRNGIMVMWRRFPVILALLGIGCRVLTMSLKMLKAGEDLVIFWQAIPEALQEWRRHHLKRATIACSSVFKYGALHFSKKAD